MEDYSIGNRWWCLKCVKVYLARDIPAFVMYCVNGESGSSLLIDSILYKFCTCLLQPTYFRVSLFIPSVLLMLLLLDFGCVATIYELWPIVKQLDIEVDSISRDEPDSPLTQYITNAGISRARYTITHCKHHHRVLWLISNRMSV